MDKGVLDNQKKDNKKARIVAINTVDYGSTGRIMQNIAKYARENGYDYWTYSMRNKTEKLPAYGHSYYMKYSEYIIHYILGRLTGANGFFSVLSTLKLIDSIKKRKPDLIHLHNIHGFNINIPILFSYLKKSGTKVVWTLHDCWAFTGHCPHYEMIGCTKWQTGCYQCPQYKMYPQSKLDNSKWMWKYKRKVFCGIPNLMIVTPSKWLENQVLHSFLCNKSIKTIYNGIDLDIFKPICSDIKSRYGINNKYLVLGVAFGWSEKKGIDVFNDLSKILPDNYVILLVGTTEENERKIDGNIIKVRKTKDPMELATLYSAADVFINPTREDTFPTVNIEALACGTPVITFNTGGSPEIIDDECGVVVTKGDLGALQDEIIRVCETQAYTSENCIKRAKRFSKDICHKQYIETYEKLMEYK